MYWANLIKITSFSCSLLLICHSMKDLRKLHYRSQAKDLRKLHYRSHAKDLRKLHYRSHAKDLRKLHYRSHAKDLVMNIQSNLP